MKVDGLGVVLAIILLPIILVTTFYIQMQVDTIATENSYNTKLLNATYDAMSAFEVNTANEKLSSVADSMRSIVLASNNVLLNSLATNLGISNASKESLKPYIPAVLYTMYDGYYIYAPTETPVVAEKTETETINGEKLTTTKGYLSFGDEDGSGTIEVSDVEGATSETPYGEILYKSDPEKVPTQKYTINKEKADHKTDYILKSYVQYSGRYQKGETDITINYTLDNYLNIVGKINGVYYTKTGYLIKKGLVKEAKLNNTISLLQYNEDDAKNKILGLKTDADETTIDAASEVTITLTDGKTSPTETTITAKFASIKTEATQLGYGNIRTISEAEECLDKAYENYENETDQIQKNKILESIQILEYEVQKYKAIAYYVSSAIFSEWVYDNLGDPTNPLKYGDIKNDAMIAYANNMESSTGEKDFYYDFTNNATPIFDENEDPEETNSKFNTHKMEVIKNSIKYNLNLSISAYCKMNNSYDFSMPVLLDEEWDKILQNISIVAFMQGWDCGLDIYNNYEIVSSTNNELTVTPSEIYYVKKDEFNKAEGNYHRIDCPELNSDGEYISFKSKEVKYDKRYNSNRSSYEYDHRNLACYKCINTNNYYDESLWDLTKNSYYARINSLIKVKVEPPTSEELSIDKRTAGYIGLAKERQNIYKTNALPVSQGYKMLYLNTSSTGSNNNGSVNWAEKINLKHIKELEIVFSETKSNTPGIREPQLALKVGVGGKEKSIVINLDQTLEQKRMITIEEESDNDIDNIQFIKNSPNYDVSYEVKSIKAIYK